MRDAFLKLIIVPCLLTDIMKFFKYRSLILVFFCFNLVVSATRGNNWKTVDKGVSFAQMGKTKQKRAKSCELTCYLRHILGQPLARDYRTQKIFRRGRY